MAALSDESMPDGSGPAGPLGTERWRVGGGHRSSAQWQAEWEDVLAATHVAFDVRFPDDRDGAGFAGSVERHRLGQLHLVDCVCTPFAGRRSTAVMGDPAEGWIGLQLVLRGAERVTRSRTQQHVLAAGAVGMWDGARAVGVEVVEPLTKRTLIFPRELVHAVSPRFADVEALPWLADRPGTRLLVRYVNALADELPELDERTAAAAGDVVLELLRAVVEPELPQARAARREALRARARRYVRAHLTDPALGPETIARALSVSLRTLHAVFEDTEESVAALVRRARLARCREDLAEPSAGSITEIAFRWGFSDATHFSHAFKREYGMAPRDVRRAATGATRPPARIGK
ncbi:helix-turn-helix domain-containing protein [Pseudonocardia xinjiangensis]|uniref:helix-turn-helix domain-containing protein n=1 Tax=Pseudonocardia xinjiangensis TaxID=75289 RepID=UPI003D8D3354